MAETVGQMIPVVVKPDECLVILTHIQAAAFLEQVREYKKNLEDPCVSVPELIRVSRTDALTEIEDMETRFKAGMERRRHGKVGQTIPGDGGAGS